MAIHYAWRWMLGVGVAMAMAVALVRFSIRLESPRYHISRGEYAAASEAASQLLGQPIALTPESEPPMNLEPITYGTLFSPSHRRSTLLASVPWFLQDIATYGIGIFTPVIITLAFGGKVHEGTVAAVIQNDVVAARGTALIDVGFLVGIAVAIVLADRWGRIPLQVTGFIGCAVGLALAGFGGSGSTNNLPLIVAGFALFQFMTNFGPNATTYLLAGELFPTKIRGMGAGFAAACGKVGAVLTAFFFPTLLKDWGTGRLLMVLVVTSLLGAAVTWIYRIEPMGRDMETL